MFGIRSFDKSAPASRIAEMAIINLFRNPKKLYLLLVLDVLILDELGQISSKLLSVLDIILRTIRRNNMFMGGILLLTSMDHLQLQPIDGRPPILSPYMISCFRFLKLEHSVRACDDPHLRRIQQITRIPANELTDEIVEEFVSLIKKHCVFVKTWNDPQLRPHMLRIFSKKWRCRRPKEI